MRPSKSRRLLFAALTSALLVTLPSARSETVMPTLKAPFDTTALRASHGVPSKRSFTCPKIPTPQVDVGVGSKYKAGSDSAEIDPKSARLVEALTSKLKSFSVPVAHMANSYVRSNPRDSRLANCSLKWLATWARAHAASLPDDRPGEGVRVQVLAAAATAYLQISDEPSLSIADRTATRSWIGALANRVRKDFDSHPDLPSRHNNQRYWAGWSVMAAAMALNDRSMFNWAIAAAREGIASVDQNGFLPLELERRQRSLGYHFYALEPLVLLAEGAARNGVDLYAQNSSAILRLALRVNSGYELPSPFQLRSGYAQDLTFANTGGKVASILIIARRFASLSPARWKTRFKKFESVAAGGDVALLFNLK